MSNISSRTEVLQPTQASSTKKRILIVDDIPSNARLMKRLLPKYDCELAFSGQEALKKLEMSPVDVVLLDVMMPDIDGFTVCSMIKQNPKLQHIPTVMVTALEDKQAKLKGLEAGANEFLTKPIDPAELSIRITNILKVKDYSDFLANYNDLLHMKLEQRTRDLEQSYHEIIHRLTISAEFKDNDTGSHIKRISSYTHHLGNLLGYKEIHILELASKMHDIGKIGIPDSILLKKGSLSYEEFEIMKQHTLIGGRILDGSHSTILQNAKIIALQHHERWDGTGYPLGLTKEDISVEARIVAIADQYDALRMARPYKPSYSHEQALKIITQGDGRTSPSHFWPLALEAFQETHRIFAEIYEQYKDLE